MRVPRIGSHVDGLDRLEHVWCKSMRLWRKTQVGLSWFARKYRKKRDKLARWKARMVGRLLAQAAASNPASLQLWLFSRLLTWLAPTIHVLPLSSHADAPSPIGPLAGPSEYESEAPLRLGAAPVTHRASLPAIRGRWFSDVCVTCNSSAVLMANAISVPAQYVGHPHAVITDPVFLVSQDRGIGIVHCPTTPQPLKSGIAVFGSGTLNWYHWLIEILPSAFLAERLPPDLASLPLLVPDISAAPAPFVEALELFARDRPRIAMPVGNTFKVGQLVLIDPVVSGPMNMREGYWPCVTDYSQNAEVLLSYRAAILDRLGVVPAPPSRRLFLARSNDRRNFNQAELIAVAEHHGFEAVYPEKMSFREQVRMYAEAEILLGASGAAFANMLFCQPGARSLTWVLPQYEGFCAYSNLAKVAGVSLNYLFVTPVVEIRSSFDAYSAAYKLSREEFDATLVQLTRRPLGALPV